MTARYGLLPDLGCIEVRGADAAAFLHGQLSRALDTLDGTRAPLAGWHDAKGRLRALVRVLRLPDRFVLLTPRSVIPATMARLKMFVLRAKVELGAQGDCHVAALLDADDAWLAAHALPPGTPASGVVARGGVRFIRIGERLWHAVGESAALAEVAPGAQPASADDAALAEIALGIPEITTPLVERYVPQMLNLDLLDAVSFDKGCYPGQEVITRIRHRGSVKRRLRRFASAGEAPVPGTAVTGPDGAEVGDVLRSARADGGSELLAVVETAAGGALQVAGSPLRELPLPYVLPPD
jgi:folate-binding protein YgfZ